MNPCALRVNIISELHFKRSHWGPALWLVLNNLSREGGDGPCSLGSLVSVGWLVLDNITQGRHQRLIAIPLPPDTPRGSFSWRFRVPAIIASELVPPERWTLVGQGTGWPRWLFCLPLEIFFSSRHTTRAHSFQPLSSATPSSNPAPSTRLKPQENKQGFDSFVRKSKSC